MSLPSASDTIPQASAAADPPLEPPADRLSAYGLRVNPKTALKVWDPAPNSGVFVLPTITAPAARILATINSSASGTKSASAGEP
jgi:hypothetical protein